MSATDFLPRREAALLSWSRTFNNALNAGSGGPAAVGVSAGQAADYNAKHNAFVAKYTLTKSPSTRTTPNIVAKNKAMRSLRSDARQLAKLIHTARGVGAAQKVTLGLTVRRPGGDSSGFPHRAPRRRSKSIRNSRTV